MKNIFIITALLFCITNNLFGQISQTQANQIISNYISSLNLSPDYLLYSFGSKNANTILNTIASGKTVSTPGNNSYFYFIDENPFANWGHNCIYLFVNSTNGSVSYTDFAYPPKNLDLATQLKFIGSLPTGKKFDFSDNMQSNLVGGTPNHCYAVIISGI